MATNTTPKSRNATIYECIDDKCTISGFTTGYSLLGNRFRQHRMSRLAPDEYLKREKRPLDDLHFLDYNKDIPESDLLIAIHHYAAEYYDRNGLWQVGNSCMNGEALLAFGWLMEAYVQTLIGDDACVFKQSSQLSLESQDEQNSSNETEVVQTKDSY